MPRSIERIGMPVFSHQEADEAFRVIQIHRAWAAIFDRNASRAGVLAIHQESVLGSVVRLDSVVTTAMLPIGY